MTTDTTELQERIAEELYYEQHPEGRHRSEWPAAVYPDTVHEYRDLAATVLPIVEAEVQAAKAEALRKIAPHLNDSGDERFLLQAATEYETGDQT